MKAFTHKGDFWSGLALAGLGAFIVSRAWGWTYLEEDGPGPGFFPLWYGAIMMLLSLLLVAGSVLKSSGTASSPRWQEMRRAMTCWLALAFSVAILKYVGFILSFGLLTWFIVAIMFRRSQKEAMLLAAGGAAGFYALFSWALDLPLPIGTFFAV